MQVPWSGVGSVQFQSALPSAGGSCVQAAGDSGVAAGRHAVISVVTGAAAVHRACDCSTAAVEGVRSNMLIVLVLLRIQ